MSTFSHSQSQEKQLSLCSLREPRVMSTFTSEEESFRESERMMDEYSFIQIVDILKSTLIEKNAFEKTHSDYLLIYANLMKYIRNKSMMQQLDSSLRDKDHDELRSYLITNSKLKKIIDFMWEESSAFPVYLIISIMKGWIVNKVFEYYEDEFFLKYIEEGLQFNINDILFLIKMKEKKVGTLRRDEKIRLLTINETIQRKSMRSDDMIIIGSGSGKITTFKMQKMNVIHSTPEEDIWLFEEIVKRSQSS